MRTPAETATTTPRVRRSRAPLRPVSARPADAVAVHALILSASRDSMVLPRDLESIRRDIADFVVIRSGRAVVACGALQTIYPGGLAEIRSVVVSPDRQGGGLGRRLIAGLLDRAREAGLRRVFVLTDRPGFFRKCGFEPTTMETLPHKVWNDCIHCPRYHDCVEVALDFAIKIQGA